MIPLPDEFEDTITEDDRLRADLLDAIGLLNQAKIFMDYLADPILSRAVRNKTERETLDRLSIAIGDFLDEVQTDELE